MSKEEILKRMETAYDIGLCKPIVFALAEAWCDAIMRLQGGQVDKFFDIMAHEAERTSKFAPHKTLANDRLGYQVIQLLAILTHPCQKCAEDKNAWHTRVAFCMDK